MAFFRVEPPEKGRIYLIKNGVWQGYQLVSKQGGLCTITNHEGGNCEITGTTTGSITNVVNYYFPATAKRLVIKGLYVTSFNETRIGCYRDTTIANTNDYAKLNPVLDVTATPTDYILDCRTNPDIKYVYFMMYSTRTYYIKEMYFEM